MRLPVRLRKLKDSGKKRLYIIPYVFTFANACLGLLAVLYAWDNLFCNASYCIVLAAIADALDGRLARALGSCSSLGKELDSLCDAISFCFAPAIVLYSVYLCKQGVIGIVAAGVYLCAGLFRLAKFNDTSAQQKNFFLGMSTPVAAIFFAMIIVWQPLLSASWVHVMYQPYCLLCLVLFFAYLMISSIKFPSFKTGFCTSPLTFGATVAMVVAVPVAILLGNPISFSVIMAYICSSLIYDACLRVTCCYVR